MELLGYKDKIKNKKIQRYEDTKIHLWSFWDGLVNYERLSGITAECLVKPMVDLVQGMDPNSHIPGALVVRQVVRSDANGAGRHHSVGGISLGCK